MGAEADSKSYSLRLQSLDATQQGNVASRVLSLTKSAFNESLIVFHSILLTKNELWKATIIVSGCCQSFNYFEISKYNNELLIIPFSGIMEIFQNKQSNKQTKLLQIFTRANLSN